MNKEPWKETETLQPVVRLGYLDNQVPELNSCGDQHLAQLETTYGWTIFDVISAQIALSMRRIAF